MTDYPPVRIPREIFRPTHQHHKGGLYRRILSAFEEQSRSEVVVYEDVNWLYFTRPVYEFDHEVLPDGQRRFSPLAASLEIDPTKLILTDVDGVLLNWAAGMWRYLAGKTSHQVKFPYEYDVQESYGLSDEEWKDAYLRFHDSEDFARIPPYSDAQKYVAKFLTAGYTFVLITAIGSDPVRLAARKENLTQHFGDVFQIIHTVEPGEGKHKWLERYPSSPWVEDDPVNADTGLALGHIPFILSAHRALFPWHNEKKRDYAPGWREIWASV